MRARTVVSLAGLAAVAAYAGFLVLHALVLDPLAAVPGTTLSAVYARVDAIGMSSAQDVVGVLVTAGIGVALAVGVAVIGMRQRMPVPVIAVCHLGLLALGAVASFQSGFFLGMDVADAYGVGGGTHGPSGPVLFGTSLVALTGIPVVLLVTSAQTLRRSRSVG